MKSNACPGKEQVAAYARGQLPHEAAEAVADHLEGCPSCEATVEAVEREADTLVGWLRQPAPKDAYLDEPECERALELVKAIGLEPSGLLTAGDVAGRTALPQLGYVREYQLLEKLGEGGMGVVYKALHTKLKRIVAVKLLPRERTKDSQAVARFEREMEAVGKLDHPNIVRAMDAGQAEGMHFLVMEYVDGLNLSELVRRCDPLSSADACELVRQAAIGLQYAHERGLIHRDIKPSNLMLTSEQQVKILDFGLALLQVDQPAGEEVTGTGQAMGTADYMAPEQVSDSHSVDIRADIYSLGCTLYKLLTGQAPFTEPEYRTTFAKMTAHVQNPPPSIRQLRPDVPEAFVAMLERMLAKDPNERFNSPSDVADAVQCWAASSDLGAMSSALVGTQPGVDSMIASSPSSVHRAKFDPYHRWLGIPAEERPANRYRLLGLKLFEDDRDVIESAADRQMAHLRTFQMGKHAEASQKLLNEVAAARVCLLNPDKKAAYDTRLKHQLRAQPAGTEKLQRNEQVGAGLGAMFEKANRDSVAVPSPYGGRRRTAKRWMVATLTTATMLLVFGIVLYITTNNGTIRIALSDNTAEVEIRVDGEPIEVTRLEEPLRLRIGEHELVVAGEDYETHCRSFTVRRCSNPVLRITLEPKKKTPLPTGDWKVLQTLEIPKVRVDLRALERALGDHAKRVGDSIEWSRAPASYVIRLPGRHNGEVLPIADSLRITFSVDQEGKLQGRVAGEDQDALAVLAPSFWYGSFAEWNIPGAVGFLEAGPHMTTLYGMLWGEYARLKRMKDVVSGGPEVKPDYWQLDLVPLFGQLKSTIATRFRQPVWVVYTAVIRWEVGSEDAASAYWAAVFERWYPRGRPYPGQTSRSLRISYQNPTASWVHGLVQLDNGNEGVVTVDDTVTLAKQRNWGTDYGFRRGVFPRSVAMSGSARWSAYGLNFGMAVLADDVEFTNLSESPGTGLVKNPGPLVHRIAPTSQSAEAKQSHETDSTIPEPRPRVSKTAPNLPGTRHAIAIANEHAQLMQQLLREAEQLVDSKEPYRHEKAKDKVQQVLAIQPEDPGTEEEVREIYRPLHERARNLLERIKDLQANPDTTDLSGIWNAGPTGKMQVELADHRDSVTGQPVPGKDVFWGIPPTEIRLQNVRWDRNGRRLTGGFDVLFANAQPRFDVNVSASVTDSVTDDANTLTVRCGEITPDPKSQKPTKPPNEWIWIARGGVDWKREEEGKASAGPPAGNDSSDREAVRPETDGGPATENSGAEMFRKVMDDYHMDKLLTVEVIGEPKHVGKDKMHASFRW